MKESYKLSNRKKAVREFFFSKFNLKSVIGLGGPDINEYIEWFNNKGFNNIQIWENNSDILFHQIKNINHKIELKYGDIVNCDIKSDVLYDLDYTCTIKSITKDIQKFSNNFIITLCLRGVKDTIEQFFKIKNEKILKIEEIKTPLLHKKYTTNKGVYLYSSYRDSTPMCCIAKII